MARYMPLSIGHGRDIQEAFRDMWPAPYVVIPTPKRVRSDEITPREYSLYGGHAALWRMGRGPTGRR